MEVLSWTMTLDGVAHTVTLHKTWKHPHMSWRVDVDGVPAVEQTPMDFRIPIDVAGHSGVIHVRNNMREYSQELLVDGKLVAGGQSKKKAVPAWGVALVAVLAVAPMVDLALSGPFALLGFIPLSLFGLACAMVSREIFQPLSLRLGLCLFMVGIGIAIQSLIVAAGMHLSR